MRSDVIHISSNGTGIDDALKQADKVAEFKQLGRKNAIYLRLIAEEIMGMMKTLTNEQDADFWIETEGDNYRLHLLMKTSMNAEKREKLLSVSTSGKNAVKGFMAKIKSAIETYIGYMERGYSETVGLGVIEQLSSSDFAEWTLSQYKKKALAEDWDELEQSIVAKLADEVRVSIKGPEVEMIIDKEMGGNE